MSVDQEPVLIVGIKLQLWWCKFVRRTTDVTGRPRRFGRQRGDIASTGGVDPARLYLFFSCGDSFSLFLRLVSPSYDAFFLPEGILKYF